MSTCFIETMRVVLFSPSTASFVALLSFCKYCKQRTSTDWKIGNCGDWIDGFRTAQNTERPSELVLLSEFQRGISMRMSSSDLALLADSRTENTRSGGTRNRKQDEIDGPSDAMPTVRSSRPWLWDSYVLF